MEKDQKAFEELKALQNIISSQEETRAKVKNWAVGLISAISVAFLTQKASFSRKGYFVISIGITILFLWLDVVHRVAQNRAIQRSNEVERILREEADYDGPKIGATLAVANTLREQIRALNNIRLYIPYIVLIIIVIVITSVQS